MREREGFDPAPYQWAMAGYEGAVASGKTICGHLAGAAAYLGYLSGKDSRKVPGVKDKQRELAISRVNRLFNGFIERFGSTDCGTLTCCDHSQKEEVERFFKEKVYEKTCFPQFEYTLSECLAAGAGGKASGEVERWESSRPDSTG